MFRFSFSCRIVPFLAAVVIAMPAAAQDSFARVTDASSGRQVFSVLGTGMGLPYASLALEMRCPTPTTWIVDVTGVQAEPGTSATFGFGDPRGGYTAIPVTPVRYAEDRLRLRVDRTDLRAALARAREDYPEPAGTDARVVIGEEVGLAIDRDALVREMTAFATECDDGARTQLIARRR